MIGESLIGEGNEVAHIDLLIGRKDGPVGVAFANALTNQSKGHTNLLAVLAPIVASQGGNAATQTMTVAVRALATRELAPTMPGAW